MVKFYHGTVTGKDDLFLESFIITGAISSKTIDPWDQRPGFYVSLHPKWAEIFGNTHDIEGAKERMDPEWNGDQNQLVGFGRGLVVEFDMEVDMKNFDFDHEWGGGWSMSLIEGMREFLPLAAQHEKGEAKEILEQFYNGMVAGQGFTVSLVGPLSMQEKKHIKDILKRLHAGEAVSGFHQDDIGKLESELAHENEPREKKYLVKHFPTPGSMGFRSSAYIQQIIHDILKEKFPEEYQQEKQRVFARMLKSDGDGDVIFKYVGIEPLKISRAYLRADNSKPYPEGLDKWEVAYDAATELGKPTQKTSSLKARF